MNLCFYPTSTPPPPKKRNNNFPFPDVHVYLDTPPANFFFTPVCLFTYIFRNYYLLFAFHFPIRFPYFLSPSLFLFFAFLRTTLIARYFPWTLMRIFDEQWDLEELKFTHNHHVHWTAHLFPSMDIACCVLVSNSLQPYQATPLLYVYQSILL
jgi:hypothetical protein